MTWTIGILLRGRGLCITPLMRGAQLDLSMAGRRIKLVLCHNAGRDHLEDMPNFPIVDFDVSMEGYLAVTR